MNDQRARRYLVVANQTLGGDDLMTVVRERIDAGPSRFHVLVPNTKPEDYTTAWSGPLGPAAGAQSTGMPQVGVVAPPSPRPEEQARQLSRRRLSEMQARIEKAGGEADGELGDPDPFEAIQDMLGTEQFDEIILSTLPAGLSRWLRMDLPSRVERIFDGPVTVVTPRK